MPPVRIKYLGLMPMTKRGYVIALACAGALALLCVGIAWGLGRLPPLWTLWQRDPPTARPGLASWLYHNFYRIILICLFLQGIDTLVVLRKFARKEAEHRAQALSPMEPPAHDGPAPKEPQAPHDPRRCDMAAQFDQDGIRFRYPENWRLEREEADHGWTVLVQSPETAFLMVALDPDMPQVDQMALTALEALREDYPELEAEERVDSLAGQPAVGHDIRFFSLDLTNTCWTRSFYGAGGTVLVMCQVNDLELEKNEPVLRAICASLEVDQD